MPAKQHTMHGRDHEHGAADPTRIAWEGATGGGGVSTTPPWIQVETGVSLASGGGFQHVSFSGGDGNASNAGFIDYVTSPYETDTYKVDWTGHPEVPVTVKRSGLYSYQMTVLFSTLEIHANPFQLLNQSINDQTGGFISLTSYTNAWQPFNETLLPVAEQPQIQSNDILAISSAPATWTTRVMHTAGAPVSGNNVLVVAALVRLGDFA